VTKGLKSALARMRPNGVAVVLTVGVFASRPCIAQTSGVDEARIASSKVEQTSFSSMGGLARNPEGVPLPQVRVNIHSVEEGSDLSVTTGGDGTFVVEGLKTGRYEVRAGKEGFAGSSVTAVELGAREHLRIDLTLATIASKAAAAPISSEPGGFFGRLAKAYVDDWKGTGDGSDPPRRGLPAPVTSPPFPFSAWPYGGSQDMGGPDTNVYPVMQGFSPSQHRVNAYGWVNGGFNISTSHQHFGNAPAAYYLEPNHVDLDQAVLYIERLADTVQTDHVDWGFRIANLYGLDYRYTTAKGYFSRQLLTNNNTYGYDPVMFYAELYVPRVWDGMNIRIGRYISLPDIEAQLAPNNYTYSHSLLYTYDAYTQTGINATVRFNDHWMAQLGVSVGNDVAPWTPDAKATLNACVGYTWSRGGDNLYGCLNSLNDGNYAYNNVQSVYATWYHKLGKTWHISTEWWYMWEKNVPSIFGPVPTQTNANGAWCSPGEDTCFAPEWAIVNYVEKEFSKKSYLSIRNEYFDDMKGQRTGFKTRYSEHLIGWGQWIGSTVLFRPEVRFERSYDIPAYENGTKKNQFIFAADVILHF